MEEIQSLLKQFTALDAALYVMVMPSVVLLRFFRAYWHGFGDRATLLGGLLFGITGTMAAAYDAPLPRPALWLITQAVSLVGAMLVGEWGARKVPWLPKDNAIANVKHLIEPPDQP